MGTLTLDHRVARAETALSRVLDGEAVLVDLEGGTYYGLDPIGTLIWERLDGSTPLGTILAAIVAEYEVTAEVAGADLLALVGELIERKLARVAAEAPAP